MSSRPPFRVPAPLPQRTDFSSDVSERLKAILGMDPREALDKLRDAQKITADLRRDEARLAAELAQYEAKYGYPSHFEHERKALLARLASHMREKLLMNGTKVVEKALDEYAHAHGEYRSFLEQAKGDRQMMEKLRADLVIVHGKIETARAVEVYFSEHCRLNGQLVMFARTELSLT